MCVYVNIFIDKFESFRILDSLIAFKIFISKFTSKFLFKEQEFMWNKESEFGSIFIFWISSVSRFLQLMKFSVFFLFDSAVSS